MPSIGLVVQGRPLAIASGLDVRPVLNQVFDQFQAVVGHVQQGPATGLFGIFHVGIFLQHVFDGCEVPLPSCRKEFIFGFLPVLNALFSGFNAYCRHHHQTDDENYFFHFDSSLILDSGTSLFPRSQRFDDFRITTIIVSASVSCIIEE